MSEQKRSESAGNEKITDNEEAKLSKTQDAKNEKPLVDKNEKAVNQKKRSSVPTSVEDADAGSNRTVESLIRKATMGEKIDKKKLSP